MVVSLHGSELHHFKGLSFTTVSASGPNAGSYDTDCLISLVLIFLLQFSYHSLLARAVILRYCPERPGQSLVPSSLFLEVEPYSICRFTYAILEVDLFFIPRLHSSKIVLQLNSLTEHRMLRGHGWVSVPCNCLSTHWLHNAPSAFRHAERGREACKYSCITRSYCNRYTDISKRYYGWEYSLYVSCVSLM